MRLLQRVAALIRANVHDLVERSDDPQKMVTQLNTDLSNQLIQVKTAVAQALADQHMLERRLAQAREEAARCEQKAQQALEHGEEAAARAQLERYNSRMRVVEETQRLVDEQKNEVQALRLALSQLETKTAEVARQRDLLMARHRRAVAREKLQNSDSGIRPERLEELLNAISGYVEGEEDRAQASEELNQDGARQNLLRMEQDAKLEQQLAALRAKLKGKDAKS